MDETTNTSRMGTTETLTTNPATNGQPNNPYSQTTQPTQPNQYSQSTQPSQYSQPAQSNQYSQTNPYYNASPAASPNPGMNTNTFGTPNTNSYYNSTYPNQTYASLPTHEDTSKGKALGIISFCCGIMSLIDNTLCCTGSSACVILAAIFTFLFGTAAIVLGCLSKNDQGKKTGFGIAGMIIGIVSMVLVVIVFGIAMIVVLLDEV